MITHEDRTVMVEQRKSTQVVSCDVGGCDAKADTTELGRIPKGWLGMAFYPGDEASFGYPRADVCPACATRLLTVNFRGKT